MKILIILIFILYSQWTYGDNPNASAECESIYHQHVLVADYITMGCKLMCTVNNQVLYTPKHEGNHCPSLINTPDYDRRICHNGECIIGSPQINYTSYGYIDVTVIRGQLPDMDPSFNPKPDGYVNVCIQKDNGLIPRPLINTSGCDCRTNIVKNTNDPHWNYTCHNWARNHKFKNDSRIIFESWDDDAPDVDYFIGSQSVTIPELIQNRNNGNVQEIDIYKTRKHQAEKHGKLWVRVTWTPEH